ncbi:MAG: hypothetical protein CL526_07735 [Aequorivita sp.]|nr:hypothetical protein [Aequorivita sp.]|tara:strand:+ start:10035 stop:10445 length:411 start_codon:yes stop_codon:yes gene_type:complete
MRKQLIALIKEHNSKESGIYIPVDVEEYVDKLLKYATIVPYFSQGVLMGFISYYNNDEFKKNAFLTMILVSKDYQGKGIGKLLLEFSIRDIQNSGFENYSLEVLKNNAKAIAFYKSYGFIQKEDRDQLWLMEKKLM